MKAPAALAAFAALSVALASTVAPALAARSSYVIDNAQMLSQNAITQINQQVGDFNAQTGKEVVVVTTTSLNGATPDAAIERSFAQQQVNGVEVFVAKNDHAIRIAGDRASSRFFPSGSYQAIAQTMRASFKAGDFDGGVQNAVSVIINTYRGHESSLRGRQPVGAVSGSVQRSQTGGGFSMGWIWWLIILAVIFFVIRGLFRAMVGPRYGPGYGPGPGYGGPGYGPGYGGYGGGGGGFWSGLLGGLGGAWLGNELFGNRGGGWGGDPNAGNYAGTVDPGQQADSSGWQSDPGQIDTSNIGGSSWGDSGGGWGGGGDSGGGWGGGDSGGG
ncbi:MAG: TPM domain-containing protein, partial [Candidatus Eremiobacteraeota bacterium]|nr:TPM domain-containing protein [Candidatus Eremiobacteraeota bacterium]